MSELELIIVFGQEDEFEEEVEEGEHEEFEAHHPWLPETSEIIWGTLAFLIIAVLLVKFGGPAIKKSMAARTERIRQDVDDAAAAKAEAQRRAGEIRDARGDIEAERQRLLAEADEAAERVLVEGRARLETEVRELEARAEAERAGASSRVVSELQAEVAALALAATDRVVVAELDERTQAELIERFVAEVGASGNGEGRR